MTKVKKSAKCSEKSSSSSESVSSLSSDEEIDASDLKPIKDYLSNRRELAHQLFKSVKTEKIRMMLPQVLKKVDLSELEEWCASELSGMSKSRILSILNGQPMLESSNTSDSDDSGPSLEIISDTEEWLTDDDIVKTEDGVSSTSRKTKVKKDKMKNKTKGHLSKKSDTNKTKVKSKVNQKESDKQKDVKVKKEGGKEAGKDKEGDSLLDLLELEMRARAIRALIRKEEDIIPDTNVNKDSSSSSAPRINNRNKISQDELRAKENCRKQLEKIITSKQVSIGDDEDVVLVVQPTPTIELLSSESENEERQPSKSTKTQQSSKSNTKSSVTNKDSCSGSVSEQSKEKLSEKIQISTTEVESVENSTLPTIDPECSLEKRRKMNDVIVKNKIKSPNGICIALNENHDVEGSNEKATLSPSLNSYATDSTTNKDQISKAEKSSTEENMIESFNTDSLEDIASADEKVKDETRSVRRRITLEDERLADMEEIIDLDDYPDDMDDMDSYDNRKSGMNSPMDRKTIKVKSDDNADKSNSAETWATRYYQTDDVQNVIKESKMQSEIRKRLRERQRLSKLNNSPTANSTSTTAAADSSADKPKAKPTGSVEEYLALKRINVAVGSSDNNSGSSISAPTEKVMTTEICVEGNKQDHGNETQLTIGNADVENESTTLNSNSETQSSDPGKEETTDIKDVEMQPG